MGYSLKYEQNSTEYSLSTCTIVCLRFKPWYGKQRLHDKIYRDKAIELTDCEEITDFCEWLRFYLTRNGASFAKNSPKNISRRFVCSIFKLLKTMFCDYFSKERNVSRSLLCRILLWNNFSVASVVQVLSSHMHN